MELIDKELIENVKRLMNTEEDNQIINNNDSSTRWYVFGLFPVDVFRGSRKSNKRFFCSIISRLFKS